jgi:endonuclease-3
MDETKRKTRAERYRKMKKILEELFPKAGMALNYETPFELLVAVALSAQCTDKRVNMVTEELFKKYKTLDDYVSADIREFEQDIRPTGFYRNKAKNILAAANMIKHDYDGVIPNTMEEITKIPSVARKTGNVVLGNLYGVVEGIAVDTHVRRTAIRFNLTDFRDPVRIERDLMEIIPKEDWFRVTYLFIEYGREICPARKHDCTLHPLTKVYPEANDIWPKSK